MWSFIPDLPLAAKRRGGGGVRFPKTTPLLLAVRAWRAMPWTGVRLFTCNRQLQIPCKRISIRARLDAKRWPQVFRHQHCFRLALRGDLSTVQQDQAVAIAG